MKTRYPVRHAEATAIHNPKRKPDDPAPASPIDALQQPTALVFQPTSPLDAKQLLTDLQALYTVRKERTLERRVAYFDTFDWRLHNRSLTLQWEAPRLSLHRLDDDRLLERETLPAAPRCADELPAGAMRRRLAKAIGIRALLPLFDCASQYETWRLLNADDKTVVRLIIERHACRAQGRAPAWARLSLKPLKGYASEAEQAQQWLAARGFMPTRAPLYASALAALATAPNAYRAKLPPLSDPKMRADAALRSILRFLFGVMRQNEAGVLDDIDTEFLHDFRVASRRARSAVGQLKGVFDAATTERLRRDLAAIGAMTNRVRDLDVYLLRRAAYRAKLPEERQAAIEPLFDQLQQDRKQAFNTLKRKLRAKTYADLMRRWEAFLDAEPAATMGPNAARPIGKLAQKRLAKLAGRVLEDGHRLLANEDDEGLHALRIDCKKLRYVLEFTSDLFPAPAVAPVARRLRKLQNALGDFHDLQVQQTTLGAYAARFQNAAAQQAMAQLIDVLEVEKQARKAAFAKQFTAFAARVDAKRRPWKRKGKRPEGKQDV